MQLANQKMLPKTLAAVVRLMTAPRSLVAVQEGAVGPLKDCGYENPIIKAITGVPISMEGKSAACAHASPLGNIAAAVADLWSNEAVQQTRLLAGNAPEAFAEILIYDTRLMNEALKDDGGPWLRDLLVASDRNLDPQAVVMDPAVHVEAGRRILAAGDDPYAQTLALARLALEVLHDAIDTGDLELEVADARWLERLDQQVEALPDDPNELAARLPAHYRDLFLPTEYGLHEDGTIPESVAVPSPVPTTL
jgi:methanol--5-hydroxybenzimidazolylcobamide Co-methyltransferase